MNFFNHFTLSHLQWHVIHCVYVFGGPYIVMQLSHLCGVQSYIYDFSAPLWCTLLHAWLNPTCVLYVVTVMTIPNLCGVIMDITNMIFLVFPLRVMVILCLRLLWLAGAFFCPFSFFFFLWYIVFLFLRRRCPLSSSTTNLLCLPYFVYIRLSSLTKFRNHLRLLCWISSDFIMFLS